MLFPSAGRLPDRLDFDFYISSLEDYKVVRIYINDIDLLDWLQRLEQPLALRDGTPHLAGAYEGLPPLCLLPPARHLYGEALPAYTHGRRVSLLEYVWSGVPGEWTFAAEIEVGTAWVRWHNFGQVRRDGSPGQPRWSYAEMGECWFERAAYDAALHRAAARAYA